ncbi:cuticle protein-like protein 3 [Dermatophagoides farinae]|nr:cuticle protein-like protein 3 [Dermatophagoides farinae]
MKSFVTILFINSFAMIIAFPLEQPIHYLPYAFGYQTADGQTRQEQGSQNGVITGSFSYTDANGDLRQVKYTADEHGYRPEGDIGVDRRTAETAAAMAALAPKGPVSSTSSWAPLSKPSFQAFDKLIASPPPAAAVPAFHAPAPAPASWNHFPAAASTTHFAPPIIGPSGYQVDTPTHKIWVKY